MDSERTPQRTMFRRLRVGVAQAADGWRGIMLAVIGGAVALLIAEALGDSQDGKALATLLGAAAGVIGAPAGLVEIDGELAATSLVVENGRVTRIYVIRNPRKVVQPRRPA